MADISPFRGIHYAPELADALPELITPPYDVISHAERQAMLLRRPECIVRVILPVDHGDVGNADDYARSAAALTEMLASAVLVEDPEPSYYVYRQTFALPGAGEAISRTSLFCALALSPYSAGQVLPHEATRAKAKQDRLELMRATHANTEPIYGLYEDPSGACAALLRAVCAEPALLSARVDGDLHEVWRVHEADRLNAITAAIPGRVWIADGHHRYETALAFSAECSLPGARRMMVALSAFEDTGLVVLPTHRLARGARPDALAAALEADFHVTPVALSDIGALLAAGEPSDRVAFGLLGPDAAWWVEQRNEEIGRIYDAAECAAWNRLDVSVVHKAVIEPRLGISISDLGTTDRLAYVRDIAEAAEALGTGGWDLAILLRGVQPAQLRDVAAAGGKMPPKSTYFYPKLWSGLLLRSLEA